MARTRYRGFPMDDRQLPGLEVLTVNMEYYASGKKYYYQPKTNYQPNIDAGLLAHVREEVLKKEEERKKERERQEEDTRRNYLVTQIQSIVKTLPK